MHEFKFEPDIPLKMNSSENDLVRTRRIDSRKSKNRNKSRMAGGQNKQTHS